jgi:small subunit ribosomal protein S1
VGETIEVKVLRVDPDERKIGLSRKRVEWAEAAEGEGKMESSSAPEVELKGGVGSDSGPLIKPMAMESEEPAPRPAPLPEDAPAPPAES